MGSSIEREPRHFGIKVLNVQKVKSNRGYNQSGEGV